LIVAPLCTKGAIVKTDLASVSSLKIKYMIAYYKIRVKDLLCGCVSYVSQHLDARAYGETYDIPFYMTDEENDNQDYIPMMNYCYPLEYGFEVPDNIKEILDEAGAITLIRKTDDDRYYLALSGGGMDLSWDICRAYMLLGYLPPLIFCSLPRFAGMNLNKIRNKKVIQACKEATRHAKIMAEVSGRKLKQLQTYGS